MGEEFIQELDVVLDELYVFQSLLQLLHPLLVPADHVSDQPVGSTQVFRVLAGQQPLQHLLQYTKKEGREGRRRGGRERKKGGGEGREEKEDV